MNARSKTQLAVTLALAASIALTFWRYQDWRAAQAAVEVARENLNRCQDLAEQIREVQQRPTMAALEETSITTLATVVESAAERARIPKSAIIRVEPQPMRRIGETDYKEQASLVEMRAVSLQQLIQLLHTLLTEQSELDVGSLRLSAPRYDVEPNADAIETWLVEVTLTYLIFAPQVTKS